MKFRYTLTLLLFTFALQAQNILPTPEEFQPKEGRFTFNQRLKVAIEGQEPDILSYLEEELLTGMGCRMKVTANNNRADLVFLADPALAEEAYVLDVSPEKIIIKASGRPGYFYALQSMYQLLLGSGTNQIPCVVINDAPRYGMRIFMLDSGRQYQNLETIKKYLDMMALLKMNTFHWHLTEGLGWRLEIKKYPQLTQKGAFVNDAPEGKGYYSQAEVKEIIAYARQRQIQVIPEIDMPGHAEAAILAYPELSCFGDTVRLKVGQGFSENIFCAGKLATMNFLKDVLNEVSTLFPSSYIHVGGDEVLKDNWNSCPDCQSLIRRKQLKDSEGLQQYFSVQIASHLRKKGKKAIFWEDVIHHPGLALPDNVVIHWWNWRRHKDAGFKKAIQAGHEVICGTNYYSYLNFPLTPWKGYKENRTFDIEDVYKKNPALNKDHHPLVLGMSAALWTDDNVRMAMIDQRLFPRIFALAEQMWHKGEPLPFEHFYQKVQQSKPSFIKLGYGFGPGLREEVPANYSWE